MIKETEIINRLQKQAKELFDSTGLVKVTGMGTQVLNYKLINQGVKPDLVIQVENKANERYLLIFEVKSPGQPRYVRMAANQLQSFIKDREKVYGIFGAPFVSEESKKICQETGIGFIDLAGNCFFKFDHVYISVEGRPNPYPATRPLKSIFAPISTRALRVLLCNPKKDWFLKDMAREANISIGQASNLKQILH